MYFSINPLWDLEGAIAGASSRIRPMCRMLGISEGLFESLLFRISSGSRGSSFSVLGHEHRRYWLPYHDTHHTEYRLERSYKAASTAAEINCIESMSSRFDEHEHGFVERKQLVPEENILARLSEDMSYRIS